MPVPRHRVCSSNAAITAGALGESAAPLRGLISGLKEAGGVKRGREGAAVPVRGCARLLQCARYPGENVVSSGERDLPGDTPAGAGASLPSSL